MRRLLRAPQKVPCPNGSPSDVGRLSPGWKAEAVLRLFRGGVVWGLFVLCLWLPACQPDARPITEDEAKTIALKHLGIADDSSRYSISIFPQGEDWVVHVVPSPPRIFGEDLWIVISRGGRIRSVSRGY